MCDTLLTIAVHKILKILAYLPYYLQYVAVTQTGLYFCQIFYRLINIVYFLDNVSDYSLISSVLYFS